MARLARLSLPGYAHHVVQRGNDRQLIGKDEADHARLLELIGEYAAREKVAVHAYAVMPNHFHLLVTPSTRNGVSKMMQAVGRRYVQYFNRRHHRSGTLWEGRYRSTLLQAERYLLACMTYMDLNPVRAGLAAKAADYRWSSHGHYAGHHVDKRVTPHALYWQLGNTPFAREARYAELVGQGLSEVQRAELTDSMLKGWALGDPAFIESLQKQTERRVVRGRAGRPRAGRDSRHST